MGTKNNPGKFDCYENAALDEPMFILLARDKHAPTLIWLWASLRELDSEDPAKVKEARECAVKMSEWCLEKGRSLPVGFGQAALASIIEMIRTINQYVRSDRRKGDVQNTPTNIEVFRAFLAETNFNEEAVPEPKD